MEKGGFSDDALKIKIKEKMDKLSGLISQEGACHIIANELGLKVFDQPTKLQIKNILTGMRNVEVTAKVLQVGEVRSFNVNGRQGKVCNVVVADETGQTRIVFWNEQTEHIANIQEGMILKIQNGYVRENNDRKEVHLNDKSKVILNPQGEKIELANIPQALITGRPSATRKSIKDLTDQDMNVELFGTVVQVFDPRFFEVCPQCFKRARLVAEGFNCDTHGIVQQNYSCVLNLFLDDGTDRIRTVLFKNQLERLLKLSSEQLIAYKDNLPGFDAHKTDLLGKMVIFTGKVNKNQMFDRIEFMVQTVNPDPDPNTELQRLEQETA